MENTTFKKIGSFQYSSEAVIVKGKLESSGIEVFMRDQYTIDTDPILSNALGGVKLFVKKDDFDKALEILSEISKNALDDNGKPIVCPKCGHEKVDLFTSVRNIGTLITAIFSLLIAALPFYADYKYKCDNCKFEFSQE
ncbi:MAG: DUF2007 domain-containing protein [Flavobacterium sp.]|nr:DUF2007 domain-containing protein [Flavobacterium sp.]